MPTLLNICKQKILPPSMANNEPSPEDLSRWLWKDTLELHTTTLVQDALTNNIPERHLTHLLSTKHTQMLWMTGCPISAHAPQRPKGNQLGAISNHNTGANKVSPICERTPAIENGFEGIFDHVSVGDAKAQNGDSPPLQGLEDMDDTSVFWEYPLNTDQTLTKVCFPRHFSCLILQAHLLAVHIFTHPVLCLSWQIHFTLAIKPPPSSPSIAEPLATPGLNLLGTLATRGEGNDAMPNNNGIRAQVCFA